jgi:AmiR/NasT family two-component response regulator
MERHGLDADQAFEVLRAASMKLNRKLRELADEIVFTGALPSGNPDRPQATDGSRHLP